MDDSRRHSAEQNRRRIIQNKVASRLLGSTAAIPTGFAALDQALGIGGFPRGAITELFGPPAIGKTTLALQWVAQAQESGQSAAWIDAEHTFDAAYAIALGVSLERLPLAKPETAEQAIEMARRLALSQAVDALVVDSAAALVPQAEMESGLAGGPDLQARVLASGLRSLARAVVKTDTAILFLNQLRSRMTPAGRESGETTAGGPALKLYAAVRLVLESGAGRTVCFRTLKNKAAGAFAEGVLRRAEGPGFAKTP